MLENTALLLHLLGFATYIGAGFTQQRLIAMSAAPDLAPAVRDAWEKLAATILVKFELPAIFTSIASGILFLIHEPAYLRQAAWFHPKLTCVFVMLVLSHLEMFNARRIVRARESGAADAEADIAARKRRHGIMGSVGALLVAVVLILVCFVRTA